MQIKRGIGIASIVFGAFSLVSSALGKITGNAISEVYSGNFGFIFGLALIIGGMVIFMSRKKARVEIIVQEVNGLRKGTTLPSILSSSRFERTARDANPEKLKEALRKIGTGQGKEEKLSDGRYSLRVTGRDRLLFRYGEGRRVELDEYSEHYHP
jgi:hypothetical protein